MALGDPQTPPPAEASPSALVKREIERSRQLVRAQLDELGRLLGRTAGRTAKIARSVVLTATVLTGIGLLLVSGLLVRAVVRFRGF